MAKKPARQSRPDAHEPIPKAANEHPAPHAAPADPVVADALARYEAKVGQDEAALRAEPWFSAAVRHGQRWKAAERAAADAAAPLEAELDRLIAANQRRSVRDPETAIRINNLMEVVQDKRANVFAEHGFHPSRLPSTPDELARELAGLLDPDLLMRMLAGVAQDGKPPDDVWQSESLDLWRCAEEMRKRAPSLPLLPVRPERGRDRLVELRAWCDRVADSRASVGTRHDGTGTMPIPAETLDRLQAGTGEASAPATGKANVRSPLSDRARAVRDLLLELPADRGMRGNAICRALAQLKPPIFLSLSSLTKDVVPELRPWGILNRPRVGYYFPKASAPPA